MTATNLVAIGTMVAAFATALATFFLLKVTGILAKETKRLADATDPHAQVVAALVPNRWSLIHVDIEIENTGNATAFDIRVVFDPPVEDGRVGEDDEGKVPFNTISILKPGQKLGSYIGHVAPFLEATYKVTTSWAIAPGSLDRTELKYELDMRDYKGMSSLGERDPLVGVATQLKRLREDWQWVSKGSRKIKVDNYSQDDRDAERRHLEEMRAARAAKSEGDNKKAS